MTAKLKIQREPFLFQLICDLFGMDGTQEFEAEQMTNREFYFFLVFVAIAMIALNFLVRIFTT
jgi:hypothetical protein